MDWAHDLIVREQALGGRSLVDIRVQGAEGLERLILNALATWQRMPSGTTEREREGEEKKNMKSEVDAILEIAEKRAGEAKE